MTRDEKRDEILGMIDVELVEKISNLLHIPSPRSRAQAILLTVEGL